MFTLWATEQQSLNSNNTWTQRKKTSEDQIIGLSVLTSDCFITELLGIPFPWMIFSFPFLYDYKWWTCHTHFSYYYWDSQAEVICLSTLFKDTIHLKSISLIRHDTVVKKLNKCFQTLHSFHEMATSTFNCEPCKRVS